MKDNQKYIVEKVTSPFIYAYNDTIDLCKRVGCTVAESVVRMSHYITNVMEYMIEKIKEK